MWRSLPPWPSLRGRQGCRRPLRAFSIWLVKAVPVLRLGWLLQLPVRDPGLYSMLVVLKGLPDARLALLVDRVIEVLTIPASALLPVARDESFHACSEAAVLVEGADRPPSLSLANPPGKGASRSFPNFALRSSGGSRVGSPVEREHNVALPRRRADWRSPVLATQRAPGRRQPA